MFFENPFINSLVIAGALFGGGFLIIRLFEFYNNFSNLKNNQPQLRKEIWDQKKRNSELQSIINEQEVQFKKQILDLKTSNKAKLDDSENKIKNLSIRNFELEKAINEKDQLFLALKNKEEKGISKITSLYADFILAEYAISSEILASKKHPAVEEARRINELKVKTKAYIEQHRQMVYRYEFLLSLFPELNYYIDEFDTIKSLEGYSDLESFSDDFDRTKYFLSIEEYNDLSIEQRNQLALNRYINGPKSNWEIGRDYELFCGQQYEKEGWQVEYFGMEKKLEDLGRDLIAKKNDEIEIIQCKYWSQNKIIHEKHITQLYGTTVVYGLVNNLSAYKITPVFISNIELSETAKKIASALNVKILTWNLKEFPRIKCNLNRDSNGKITKIYHLPFDQQYDRTRIKDKGEFYAYTVDEAMKKGFRRAYKFYGQ